MSAAVRNVTAAEFSAEVLQSSVPVVVDFWAPWCGPCRMVAPELEKVAAALGEKVKVVKVNVDENSQLAGGMSVMSIPTLIVFNGGKEVARQVGFLPADALVKYLEQNLLTPAR
ncbi:MAG: thioredoxin [Armatimonadota bacterium]